MTLPIVGVDLAKSKFDFAFLQDKRVIHDVLPNDAAGAQALHQWLAARHIEQAHICMEATDTYGDDLAAGFHALGHRVSILNPAVLKAFRQRHSPVPRTTVSMRSCWRAIAPFINPNRGHRPLQKSVNYRLWLDGSKTSSRCVNKNTIG